MSRWSMILSAARTFDIHERVEFRAHALISGVEHRLIGDERKITLGELVKVQTVAMIAAVDHHVLIVDALGFTDITFRTLHGHFLFV
ncbi:MAG: hypothetical protein U5O39_14095 [Gammaproteobacteria bacterium]|nr:hypothetical protein [Gammaproteobacteria bacterium]